MADKTVKIFVTGSRSNITCQEGYKIFNNPTADYAVIRCNNKRNDTRQITYKFKTFTKGFKSADST